MLGANSAEARRDFASWMGSAGIFASGTGLVELEAGIVIASTNPSPLPLRRSPELGALLRKSGASVQPVSIPGAQASVAVELNGLPVTLEHRRRPRRHGQTKFVIGLSEASVTAALNPSSTLASSASYSAASTALGEGIRPSLSRRLPDVPRPARRVGLSEEPSISKLVPVRCARSRRSPAAARASAGGVERLRVVAGLQHTE